MDEKYMRRAIEVAKQGEEYDEVPIGCVVVKDGEIIAEAHNRKEENKSALCHAEMLALAEASGPCDVQQIHRMRWSTMTFNAFELGSEARVRHALDVLRQGGVVLEEIHALPWSSCCATVIDRWGVCWWIAI